MEDNKLKTRTPDPLASSEEKATNEYGLLIAREIAAYWFNGGLINSGCNYSKRRDWIIQKRTYARGKQDVKRYQDILAGKDVELSYMNLDWRPLNIPGKFVRIVVNGNKEDVLYRLNINAIDKTSSTIRKNRVEKMRKDMVSMKMLQQAKKLLSIDMTPTGFVPENEEEIQLHNQMNPKIEQEIAQELLFDTVKKMNRWNSIKDRVDYDLTECGLAGVHVSTCKTEGIKIREVDVENLVHSYVNKNDFSDCYYYGEVVTKTINDIRRESNLSDTQLRTLAYQYHKKNHDTRRFFGVSYSSIDIDEILDYQIDVLNFSYKSSKEQVYKKKNKSKGGGFKMIKKGSDYNPPKRSDYSKESRVLDTWYEGSYVIGTDIIYNYGEAENIQKDKMNRALSSYIVRATGIYKNQLSSLIDDIEPIIDEMQRVYLKLQHLVSEIKPSGVEIDWDMMVSLAEGGEGGKAMDPKEIISLFAAKGIVFKKRTYDAEGNLIIGRAVEKIENGIPNHLFHLTNTWTFYYNIIRDIIGINPFRDGTQPHDALVGVQKTALEQSNLSTEHITKASMDITLRTAEVSSTRLRDIFKWSDIKDIYVNAIGERNMEVLETTKNIHLHEFGYVIEMLPSKEELERFEENLRIALKNNEIKSADLFDVREVAKTNPKLASQLLNYRARKYQEELRKYKKEDAQMKTMGDIRSAQEASKSRIVEAQELAKIEVEKAYRISKIKISEQAEIMRVKQPYDEQKLAVEVYEKHLEAKANAELTKYKEEKKDERQDKKDSNASRLITQRKDDSDPIDFTEDLSIEDALNSINSAVN